MAFDFVKASTSQFANSFWVCFISNQEDVTVPKIERVFQLREIVVQITLHMDFKHIGRDGLLDPSPNNIQLPQIECIFLLRNVILQIPDL